MLSDAPAIAATSAQNVIQIDMLMRTPNEPQREPPWEPWRPGSRILLVVAVAIAVMALTFIVAALEGK